MNARGELLGRLAIAVLAGLCGRYVLDPPAGDPVWLQQVLLVGVFSLGYMFGLAPTVSRWIEEIWGERHEGDSQ